MDLDFFPTELFTKLTVNKSHPLPGCSKAAPPAIIDIRSARPFDHPGIARCLLRRQASEAEQGREQMGASAVLLLANLQLSVTFRSSRRRRRSPQ